MDAEFSNNQPGAATEIIKKAAPSAFQWSENVRKAYLGMQVDPTFRSRLEILMNRNFESDNLRQCPEELALNAAGAGGAAAPAPLKRPDALSDLIAMGLLNQAAMLNVAHITGDTFMIKSALNVYRSGQKEEEVEPVQSVDGEVGGQS